MWEELLIDSGLNERGSLNPSLSSNPKMKASELAKELEPQD